MTKSIDGREGDLVNGYGSDLGEDAGERRHRGWGMRDWKSELVASRFSKLVSMGLDRKDKEVEPTLSRRSNSLNAIRSVNEKT